MRGLQHGFTLLELMVVVVLIGIVLTFVVRSVGDGGRSDRIRHEVQRLNALVELVAEEAVLRSVVIGLRFEEQGYTFMQLSEQQWQTLEQDGLMRPRQLDQTMALQLTVEGFGITLQTTPAAEGEEQGPQPQVVFLPSGERTPFEVALYYRDDESGYLLRVPTLGLAEQRQLQGE